MIIFVFAIIQANIPETKTRENAQQEVDEFQRLQAFHDYYMEVRNVEELTICNVTFTSLPPTPEIAGGFLRDAVEALVKKDGSREILAFAFNASGDALPDTHYGGPLIYMPSDGQILPMDERRGLQATESD